jgi:hypothetical protein
MILDDEKSTDHTVTHVASKTTTIFIIYINNFDKAQKWYSTSESVKAHTLESNPLSQGHHITILIDTEQNMGGKFRQKAIVMKSFKISALNLTHIKK